MNTTFNILWFEDEFTWFEMEKLQIESILKSHYLVPYIVRKDGDDFNICELTGNDYDLILMDFKLSNGATGDVLVSTLRENSILTDIVFYSSEEDAMLDAIRANMPPIDGVYLTKRDYKVFTEKTRKIIEKVVRRSEDIVNLRGFVLENACDFELRIKEILNLCWAKFDDTQKRSLTESLVVILNGKKSRLKKQVEKAISSSLIFEKANNDKYLLSISDRLDLFQNFLSFLHTDYKMLDATCPRDFKQYYIEKINIYRNCLGHITFKEKTIRVNNKDIEINQDFHRLLRKNIADVDAKISHIEDYITKMI